jgi:threonine/homoserine/homoserine lactone efflux protein
MLEYGLFGAGLAFAAAIQPGPLQAFLLSRVAATGWRRTLPASLSPLLSDGPIALVALLVLSRVPPQVQDVLRAAGGLLLLYLAWIAARQWRRPADPGSAVTTPRTLRDAVLVNLLNPNPYLGWAFVLGPAVLAAWRERPASAVFLLTCFYGTMVLTLAAFVTLMGTARFLGPRGQRALLGASALVLAGLGLYLFVTAFLALVAT